MSKNLYLLLQSTSSTQDFRSRKKPLGAGDVLVVAVSQKQLGQPVYEVLLHPMPVQGEDRHPPSVRGLRVTDIPETIPPSQKLQDLGGAGRGLNVIGAHMVLISN